MVIAQALINRGLTPVFPSGNALERQRAERIVAAVVTVAARLRIDKDRRIANFFRLSDFQPIGRDDLGLDCLGLGRRSDRC